MENMRLVKVPDGLLYWVLQAGGTPTVFMVKPYKKGQRSNRFCLMMDVPVVGMDMKALPEAV